MSLNLRRAVNNEFRSGVTTINRAKNIGHKKFVELNCSESLDNNNKYINILVIVILIDVCLMHRAPTPVGINNIYMQDVV